MPNYCKKIIDMHGNSPVGLNRFLLPCVTKEIYLTLQKIVIILENGN